MHGQRIKATILRLQILKEILIIETAVLEQDFKARSTDIRPPITVSRRTLTKKYLQALTEYGARGLTI